MKLKKGTAAGKDGIPNETWPKTLTMLSAKLKRGVDWWKHTETMEWIDNMPRTHERIQGEEWKL